MTRVAAGVKVECVACRTVEPCNSAASARVLGWRRIVASILKSEYDGKDVGRRTHIGWCPACSRIYDVQDDK